MRNSLNERIEFHNKNKHYVNIHAVNESFDGFIIDFDDLGIILDSSIGDIEHTWSRHIWVAKKAITAIKINEYTTFHMNKYNENGELINE